MNLNDIPKEFVSAIKKTAEYNDFKQALSLINRNPVLKKKVEDIVRLQQELMFDHNPAQQQLDAKISRFNEEFKKLSVIPEVSKYLTAGKNFNNMISQIFKTLRDSIDYDLRNN